MNMLENLLGGGKQRSGWDDFVNRYDQGPPWVGISDEEAVQRYDQVAGRLPAGAYEEAAREGVARMSPQERLEFGRYIQQQSRQRGMDIPDFNRDGIDDRLQDPDYLAGATSRMQQRQPGMLEQMLGGGGGMGGMLSNPLAKAALAGIAAMAVKKMVSR